MNYDATQHTTSYGSTLVRSSCAYATLYIGIVLGAIALTILCSAGKLGATYTGIIWLLGAVLTFWLGWGLVESNVHSWKILHGAGAIITGGVGVVLVLYGIQDAMHYNPETSVTSISQIICWLLGGLVLFIWACGQIATHRIAHLSWQVAVFPLGIGASVLWVNNLQAALQQHQTSALIISLCWFVGCVVVVRLLVRPDHHAIMASLMQVDDKIDIPKHFPTKYHELLARGRLCEIFELPCKNPCPLTTKVAMQYQQLRVRHHDSPQMLEALEKAYAVLITPRSRELCGIAHEILAAKEKQLGKRQYESIEVLLWAKLWKRLQEKDIKGDPERARAEKQRLMKEF